MSLKGKSSSSFWHWSNRQLGNDLFRYAGSRICLTTKPMRRKRIPEITCGTVSAIASRKSTVSFLFQGQFLVSLKIQFHCFFITQIPREYISTSLLPFIFIIQVNTIRLVLFPEDCPFRDLPLKTLKLYRYFGSSLLIPFGMVAITWIDDRVQCK